MTTYPPIQRRASRAAFASLAVFGLALRCFAAPAVTDPAYTISTLTSSLPSAVTGITADPATGTIYVGQQNSSTTAVAYSVTPAGVVTNLGVNTTTGYPYVASDIQFLNGKLYTASFSGVVSVRNATAGGTAAAAYTVTGGNEMGVTTKNGYIYSSSGSGVSPQALYRYDPATSHVTTVVTGLPAYPSSLSADPTSNYLYFATYGGVSFHRINLATSTLDSSWSVTGSGIGSYGNFAVDPTGQFLFSKYSNTVVKISVATQSLVGTFVSGLSDTAYDSVCFGPSSSGSGYSLYIADGIAVREVRGFPAPGPTVFASGISPVIAWDPIYPAAALPDWTTESNPSGPTVGPNANWVNPHAASVFPKGTHPWENVPPMNFDAFWINAWSNITSQGPAGQSWTKYSTTVTGQGDFVLQFLADNVSWIYIDGNLIGYQAWNWDQVGTGRYTIHLSGAGSHELVFIIWDGGGAAGGKFRLETTQSFQNNNPGAELPPAPTPADTTPPVITAPSTITKEATSASGAVVTFTATANDAVSGSVPVTATPASGSTFPLGISSVSLSATDAASNTAHANIVVNVQDTTAPVVTAPANVVAEATSASGAVVNYPAATATDAVGVTSLTSSPASGSTFPLGSTTVTATAKDAAGNAGTDSFTVTVRDTTAPALTVPASQTLEATGPTGAVATFVASATDAVGVTSLTYDWPSGTTFPLGKTLVTVNAKDAADNSSSGTFTVTVRDTTPPVIALPANQTLEATSAAGAAATFSATASDIVSGTVTVGFSKSSGSTFALGVNTVTATATDAAGNTATGTFTITVRDTTAPTIATPASIVAEATSAAGAAVSFTTSASDLVDGAVAVSPSKASGSTFAIGTTTVTLTATDAAHNSATSTFTVTVRDTTAPVLTLPASQTLEATSAAGAVANFAATATDAVGVASLTYSTATGSTFAIGTTTVTVTAKDAAGNTTSGTFTVTVRDTTAPTITSLTPSQATLWPPNHQMVAITLTAAASDIVGVSSLKIVNVTSNEPDNGLGDGDTAGDIQVTGALTLNLRAERAGGGNGRVYTITVEARDAAGNATTRTTTVSVPKSQNGK